MRPSSSVDHPGRAFLALAVFFRHVGLVDDELSPHVRELATARMLDRARVLGAVAARRLSGLGLDAGRAAAHADGGRARQAEAASCTGSFAALAGERLFNRLRQLARLIGREPVMETAD